MSKKLRLHLLFTAGLILFSLLSLFIFGNLPYEQNLAASLAAPSSQHILGTDQFGRDVLVRVLAGTGFTLVPTLFTVALVFVVGTIIGMTAGFFGGRVEFCLLGLTEIFLAVPSLVFAIAIAGILGGGIFGAVLALVIVGWAKYARLAAVLTKTIVRADFISAAKILGAGKITIIYRHILPNIAAPLLTTAALDIGTTMMELAGLSFLGIGAMPPTPEWGAMMNEGRKFILSAPQIIVAPGLLIFMMVANFNSLGEELRQYFAVKIL